MDQASSDDDEDDANQSDTTLSPFTWYPAIGKGCGRGKVGRVADVSSENLDIARRSHTSIVNNATKVLKGDEEENENDTTGDENVGNE